MATESALAILLQSALTAGLTARGLTATVQKNQQPRQQGVPSAAVILFHHVGTVNVGWPYRGDVWNAVSGKFDHTEIQRRESRYQIGALAPQSPNNATLPTPADFCLAMSAVMQSDATRATLLAANVGVQHITDIRSVYFVDDKDQNQESPSFDVVLSHQDSFATTTPKIDVINPTVNPVL